MKQVIRLSVLFCAAAIFALTGVAGPEPLPSGKEMKQVAPVPPPMCDWTGMYIGVHGGGQFGHSEISDSETGRRFGFEENGFNGGGQFGYNFQFGRFVTGFEADVGYMNVEGDGDEFPFSDVHGETDSDFYTTLRGRIGVTLGSGGCWLVYGTGGAIGMNYTARFHVDPDFFDARDSDFEWGYTVGGGIERRISRHWSIKAEYLYFRIDDLSFSNTMSGIHADFDAHTFGHIVRAGLNYKF